MHTEMVVDIVKQILFEKYIEFNINNEMDEYIDELINKKVLSDDIITNDIYEEFSSIEECFAIYPVNYDRGIVLNNKIIEKVLDGISNNYGDECGNYTSFELYVIFHKIEDKYKFDADYKEIGFKRKLTSTLKSKGMKINAKCIEIKTIFLKNCTQEKFSIEIQDRIRSLENSRIKYLDENKDTSIGIEVNGFVFSANLEHITEMYNLLGNSLFEKNLRYSIDDELNVDIYIKSTLKENPEEFWYLNNGITMIVEDDDFKLRKSNTIDIYYNDKKSASIINGAQTVSAATYYYHYLKDFIQSNKNGHDKENSVSSAFVMLRIIQLKKFNKNNERIDELNKLYHDEINKISIALNRQKPIKHQDIGYTTSFVYSINQIYYKDKDSIHNFSIEKRGSEISEGYNLLEFAKLVKTYLCQEPGKALNDSEGNLLVVEKDEFLETEIFKNEIIETNEEINIFNKYYKPVNFASKLVKLYLKYNSKEMIRKCELDGNNKITSSIAKYGKYYFTAYTILVLNDFSNIDFSKFDSKLEFMNKLNKKEFTEFIGDFIEILSEVVIFKYKTSNSDINIGISTFKNDDLYKYLKDYKDKNLEESLINKIEEYNEKLHQYFNTTNLEREVIEAKMA